MDQVMKKSEPLASLPREWLPFLLKNLPDWGISPARAALKAITGGGSRRAFYRLTEGTNSVILNHTPDSEEFHYYIAIGSYLRDRDIPVPAFLAMDSRLGLALLEDGGSMSLYNRVGLIRADMAPATEAEAALWESYLPVLEGVVRLHRLDPQDCPELTSRAFDSALWRWETDYFRQRFLEGLLGWRDIAPALLERAFNYLAQRLDKLPRVVVHRDFQSQNILVSGRKVCFVDFQGARLGPWMYDLASLLKDPYVGLESVLQEKLLVTYLELAGRPDSLEEIYADYDLVALQRLMQALGAYGYLGLVKGDRAFLKHIPSALLQLDLTFDHLENQEPRAGELQPLREMIKRARAQVESQMPA